MARFIIAALCLFCTQASAQTFGLHVGSYHDKPGFNNVNPGAYVRFANGVTAGFYRNSIDRDSVYVGYTAERFIGPVGFAVTAGAITGYRHDVLPLLVPSIKFSHLRLAFIPKAAKGGSGSVHVMLELGTFTF